MVVLRQVSRPLRKYQVVGQPAAVLVGIVFLAAKEITKEAAEEGTQAPLLLAAVAATLLVQPVQVVYKVL